MHQTLIPADNWFAVLDPWSDEYPDAAVETIDIHRVIMWKETPNGVVGLVSPELNGGVLSENYCNSMSGTIYKHLDDLTDRELQALALKRKGCSVKHLEERVSG